MAYRADQVNAVLGSRVYIKNGNIKRLPLLYPINNLLIEF